MADDTETLEGISAEAVCLMVARLKGRPARNAWDWEAAGMLRRLLAANARLERERDALLDEWREIAAGLTTEQPEVGALWPLVSEVSGNLSAVRLHFRNEVAAHNATKAERDAATSALAAMTLRAEAAETVALAVEVGLISVPISQEAYDKVVGERDAATSALAKAEGERDRLLADNTRLKRMAYPTSAQELSTAFGHLNGFVQSLVLGDPRQSVTVGAALTPAPEAPKDGE